MNTEQPKSRTRTAKVTLASALAQDGVFAFAYLPITASFPAVKFAKPEVLTAADRGMWEKSLRLVGDFMQASREPVIRLLLENYTIVAQREDNGSIVMSVVVKNHAISKSIHRLIRSLIKNKAMVPDGTSGDEV